MARFRVALAARVGGVLCAAPAAALVGAAEEGGPLEPHVVMVLKRAPSGSGFCSGVVIARNVVLTAAHCVAKLDDTRVHFHEGAGRPMLKPVAAIAVHPQYRANAIATREKSVDLALVRTVEPLPERFVPARIDPAPALTPGMRLRIAGYGVAREGWADTAGTYREGTLAVRAPLSNILVWAEDPLKKGFGACSGDSGGPIFSADTSALVAITDWSQGESVKTHCGSLTQGALLAPQRAWIETVLRGWGL